MGGGKRLRGFIRHPVMACYGVLGVTDGKHSDDVQLPPESWSFTMFYLNIYG